MNSNLCKPRTGHTREPDPTHNELKHTTTRKTATHERSNAPNTIPGVLCVMNS